MKYKGTEAAFQATIARHLNLSGSLWCHVPNEGKRKGSTGANLTRQGLKKGVPDILIFDARAGFGGLAIELKVKGRKASPEQKEWLKQLQYIGWLCMVSDDIDAVLLTINDYLKEPVTKKEVK